MKTEEDCVNHATECWNRGLNCAESVMRGACFAADINLPDIAKRIATPFGGGIGRAEDICGALAGGVLAIGAVLGRAEAEDDRFRSYMVAKELHEAFLGRFGATACKELNFGDFITSDHRRRCTEIVRESARLAYRTIGGRM